MRLPAGSTAMPIITPVVSERAWLAIHRAARRLDRRHGGGHVGDVENHVGDRVLGGVRVAVHDDDRHAPIRLGGLDRRAEIHEDLRPGRHRDPVDLLHGKRRLVELGERHGVRRRDSHGIQGHVRVRDLSDHQRRACAHHDCADPVHGHLPRESRTGTGDSNATWTRTPGSEQSGPRTNVAVRANNRSYFFGTSFRILPALPSTST